jgi:UDP-glucose 4-epimerase
MPKTATGRKVLVTGGAGFIGSHLVGGLLNRGYSVVVLDNLSSGHSSNLDDFIDQIDFRKGDIRDHALVDACLKGCDTVFHLAALVSVPYSVENPMESVLVNEVGTMTVFEAAKKNQCRRLVFTSSCSVYGDDPASPHHEGLAANPLSPYAVQKWCGEKYAKLFHVLYGLDTISLRFFNVYGPRQDPSSPYSGVISIFLKQIFEQHPPTIYGSGKQTRDFIYVGDVVKALLLAAEVPEADGDVVNIGTGRAIEISELWEKICRISRVFFKPAYAPQRPGDILHSEASTEQAVRKLGFTPDYSLEEGLAATHDWYVKNHRD